MRDNLRFALSLLVISMAPFMFGAGIEYAHNHSSRFGIDSSGNTVIYDSAGTVRVTITSDGFELPDDFEFFTGTGTDKCGYRVDAGGERWNMIINGSETAGYGVDFDAVQYKSTVIQGTNWYPATGTAFNMFGNVALQSKAMTGITSISRVEIADGYVATPASGQRVDWASTDGDTKEKDDSADVQTYINH